MALGLLFLAGCVVLVGVRTMQESQDAGRIAQILGLVFALLGLAIPVVTWTPPSTKQLDAERERLAGAIAQQWRQEALACSLGYPEPMPVCWGLAEPAVMDHPRLIADGGLSFTGRSDQIGALAAEFRRLRRRRLVILGGPGSGKTTLAVQLLLELLENREPGEPIPVLLSLAEWDPIDEPQLHTWLAGRLAKDYPSLRAAGPDMADALAKQGHLLPILDGLDELPQTRRPEVIAALNKSLADTDQLVLTSRTTEYTTAIAEAGTVLTSAAVIAPKPLTSAQAADYLTHCLPVDPGPSWDKLLHRLRTNTAGHLATVLATPLGLWLVRTIYITPRRDPAPLLDTSLDATTLQVELLDQLIPAVLTTRPAARDPGDPFRPRRTWNPPDVRSWLTYLAQHLQRTDTQNQNLHWWHLARHTLTNRAVKLMVGLLVGLGFGLPAGLAYGQTYELPGGLGGLAFGLALGLTFGMLFGPAAERWLEDEPAYANLQMKQRFTLLTRSLVAGLKVALVVGLTVGLTIGLVFGLAADPRAGLIAGLTAGLAIGLAGGLMVGLMQWVGLPNPNKTEGASRPQSTYKATRTLTFLQLGLALLTIGLGAGLASRLARRLTGELTDPVVGLTAGLTGGLIAGLAGGLAARVRSKLVIRSGAWLCYVLAAYRLAAAGKLPLRLMGFLDDAYRLGLLRTVGPAYQFRHAEFQKHLVRSARNGTATE